MKRGTAQTFIGSVADMLIHMLFLDVTSDLVISPHANQVILSFPHFLNLGLLLAAFLNLLIDRGNHLAQV